jgi:hypothetical protein
VTRRSGIGRLIVAVATRTGMEPGSECGREAGQRASGRATIDLGECMDGNTRRRGRTVIPHVIGLALAVIAVSLDVAMVEAQDPPRVRFGAGLTGDLLVGDASDFLDGGGGRFLMADFRLDERDRFQLRLDGTWTGLDHDTDEVTGATAENDLFMLMAGPQLTGRIGRFRPYGAGLAGLVTIAWRTDPGIGDRESDVEGGLAWGAHAGLGIVLDEGDHPVMLQAEARLIQAGEYAFGRAPAVVGQGPVGLVRSDFGVLSLRVGVTLGF